MRLITALVLVAVVAVAAVDATKLHGVRRMHRAGAATDPKKPAADPKKPAEEKKTDPKAASPVPVFKPVDAKTLNSIKAPTAVEIGKLPSALPTSIPIVATAANGNVGPTAANQLLVKRFATVKGVSIKEAEYQRHFENFMRKHKRVYKQEDLTNRYNLYKQHWNYVDNFNKMKPERATFTLATNAFMDHSNAEFKKRMGFKSARTHAPASVMQKNAKIIEGIESNSKIIKGATPAPPGSTGVKTLGQAARMKQIPASKNWADDTNVVSPVRMQGTCGSCWAFVTATVVESANAILTGKLRPSSPQHLLDCCGGMAWAPCDACNGGDFMTAYRFTAGGGLCAWDDYPYTGVQGTCRQCKSVNWISGGAVVATNGDEASLMAAVTISPVATAVHANLPTFQFYSSGIYNDLDCPKDFGSLDHAVTITGYGSEDGKDYWWLRNTWDTNWGESGYMRLARGVNACGVALEATQPTARLDPNSADGSDQDRAAAEDAGRVLRSGAPTQQQSQAAPLKAAPPTAPVKKQT